MAKHGRVSAGGTGRVEAFSDGVFAIAITLLVLEIPVPHAGVDASSAGLWTALGALWPSYLAFVLSFFVILIMWVNHHELMRLVRAVDYPFLFANGFLLLMVTFVPFPTAVLAEHLATADGAAGVAFYCGSFAFSSLTWGGPLPDDRPAGPAAGGGPPRDDHPHPARLHRRPGGLRDLHRRGLLPAVRGAGDERIAVAAVDPALLPLDPCGRGGVEPRRCIMRTDAIQLRTDLRPGDIGCLIRLHGVLYAREYGFDHTFEAYVAGPMSEFARSDSDRERLWIAECDERIVGCIAIVASSADVAQLRWFLVDPSCRGVGLGRRLLNEAVTFSRAAGYRSIVLWTVSELVAAAHLYRAAGFTKSEEIPGRRWGADVVEEKYELSLI